MAPVGTGPGQMCAPDVGQGGLSGNGGNVGCSWASRTGMRPPPWAAPSLPRLKQAWVPDVSAGKERQREESCQQAGPAAAPTPNHSPARDKAPRPPALLLVHFAASEVPVTVRHHETGWSLEPSVGTSGLFWTFPRLECTLSRCLRLAFAFWFYNLESSPGSPVPWPGHCSSSLDCMSQLVQEGLTPSLAGTREVIAVGSGHTELSLLAPDAAVTQ